MEVPSPTWDQKYWESAVGILLRLMFQHRELHHIQVRKHFGRRPVELSILGSFATSIS